MSFSFFSLLIACHHLSGKRKIKAIVFFFYVQQPSCLAYELVRGFCKDVFAKS